MSSIAYVTDEKMIEYHRLCGAREMNFWRLSSKKDFTDFRKGDLLFFYARAPHTRRKGFVGYAHYVSTRKLSLHQMWKKYRTLNGYDSEQLLSEAIHRAAKDRPVPEQMNCLYLNDAVFFMSAVYPSDIGLSISSSLESYCYLDQEDPQATVRILKQAEKRAALILWSAAQNAEPAAIFSGGDEIRHQLAVICTQGIGKSRWQAPKALNPRMRSKTGERCRVAAGKLGTDPGQRIPTAVQISDLDAIILAHAICLQQAKDYSERPQPN
jgi:hypothetical protein